MTEAGAPKPDPAAIRRIPKPPFVRLPEPARLFAARAARLRQLGESGDLAPYLRFVASIAELQSRLAAELPPPAAPPAEARARAARHAMPPLERTGLAGDATLERTLGALVAGAAALDLPAPARAALERLAAGDRNSRAGMVANVLGDTIPADAIAEHALVAAALQVHFAALASQLDPAALKPVADGACPACGAPPATSLVVGWPEAEGTRYCSCSLCATLWNYVRAKCALCGSTKSISFREIDGGAGDVKAEICGVCDGYVKVLYQHKNPALDPVADDIATLGLDILVRELDVRRGGVNPFLAGY